MKNLFQKIFKPISTHLFSLVLGICLVIGATAAFAAWNDAKTGGSGQLSEVNWNALVTMLETNLDASISSRAAARTCGNGVVEGGEGCDDGGTSWTSGACAGDCSRTNYWSAPVIGSRRLLSDATSASRYCQEMGFGRYLSKTEECAFDPEAGNRGCSNVYCVKWAAPSGGLYYWMDEFNLGYCYVLTIFCGN